MIKRRKLDIASFALVCLFLCPQANAQAKYTLKPTAKTVAWGYYDAKAAPVLRGNSGDTVQIHTLITSGPKRLEEVVHMMIPKAIFVLAPPPK